MTAFVNPAGHIFVPRFLARPTSNGAPRDVTSTKLTKRRNAPTSGGVLRCFTNKWTTQQQHGFTGVVPTHNVLRVWSFTVYPAQDTKRPRNPAEKTGIISTIRTNTVPQAHVATSINQNNIAINPRVQGTSKKRNALKIKTEGVAHIYLRRAETTTEA